MITNFFIQPNALLQPFVESYILSTSDGQPISYNSQWPANNETAMLFYLYDQPVHFTPNADCSLHGKPAYLIGLLTHYNGWVNFSGIYHTFIIQFKLNGFHQIFRIPMTGITDKIYAVDDVLGSSTNKLYEVLKSAAGVNEMAESADRFLLQFLNQKKAETLNAIGAVVKEVNNTRTFFNVSEYARRVNMSVRNFERVFTEQAGVSPKEYIKLARFNECLKMKLLFPERRWISIAQDCGYFDQAHLIKDFRQYTNRTPTGFFREDKAFNRPSINMFESDAITFNQLNESMPKEQFVFVARTS